MALLSLKIYEGSDRENDSGCKVSPQSFAPCRTFINESNIETLSDANMIVVSDPYHFVQFSV